MAGAAPLHGSECRVRDPDSPGARTVERACEPWNRDPGMYVSSFRRSAPCSKVLLRVPLLACHRCLLLGGRYCVPLATLAAQGPQLAPRPQVRPPPLAARPQPPRGNPTPDLHLGRGVWGREPLLEGWPWNGALLLLEGLGSLCAPSDCLWENLILSSLVPSFWGPYGPVAHTTVPALGGPEPLCRVRGGAQGTVGHKGRVYRPLPHAHL